MPQIPAAIPTKDIIIGDCIQTMRGWPKASIDLIFADPPYNIGYQYDQYEDKRKDDDYVEWTKNWVSACADLLKPSGSFYILIGDEYAAETRVHLKELEKRKKLAFRNWIIWHYTFGQNCRTKFNRSHAHLFYCVGPGVFGEKQKHNLGVGQIDLSKLPYRFNRQEVAVKSARQTTYGDARANPTGKLPDDTWYLRPQEAIEAPPIEDRPQLFDADGDTWYVPRLAGTFKERVAWHPCQLPEALLERVIKLSSNEGDLVFDPFAGSGTTLAVAARLKRRWLGCEMSEDYRAKAMERVAHVEKTGTALIQNDVEKGIDRTITKKKPEPKRSIPPRRGTSAAFAEEAAKAGT
jgi:site-specific DNA-methyltransferase (adenine-specific)